MCALLLFAQPLARKFIQKKPNCNQTLLRMTRGTAKAPPALSTLKLVPPKNIPSINLLSNVIQTRIITISDDSVALLLKRRHRQTHVSCYCYLLQGIFPDRNPLQFHFLLPLSTPLELQQASSYMKDIISQHHACAIIGLSKIGSICLLTPFVIG